MEIDPTKQTVIPKIKIELEDGNSYLVPEDILRNASDYFVAALKPGTFKEGEQRRLVLPGCDKTTLDCFLHWCLTGKLPPIITLAKDKECWTFKGIYNDLAITFINIWAFGDVCLLPKLQNPVMRNLINLLDFQCMSPRVVYTAAIQTSPTSLLTKALLMSGQHDFYKLTFRKKDHVYIEKLGDVLGFWSAWFNLVQEKCSIEDTDYQRAGEESVTTLKFRLDLKDYLMPGDDDQENHDQQDEDVGGQDEEDESSEEGAHS